MVLRRYTPPTCTLEINANNSPLSHWTGKPVLKNLRFQLSFDDPKLPEEKQVTISGNRTQLETLCQVVETYVQNFLVQSPERLNSVLLPEQTNKAAAFRSELPDLEVKESLDSPELAQVKEPSWEDLGNINDQSLTNKSEIYLQPKSLLYHTLFLGSLANQESGAILNLSVLQLFDLASALDGYSTEVVAIPNLNQSNWFKKLPDWAPMAAVFLLGVGLTSVIFEFSQSPGKQQVATTTSNQSSNLLASQPITNPIAPVGTLAPVPLAGVPKPPGNLNTAIATPPPNNLSVSASKIPPLVQPPPLPVNSSSVPPSTAQNQPAPVAPVAPAPQSLSIPELSNTPVAPPAPPAPLAPQSLSIPELPDTPVAAPAPRTVNPAPAPIFFPEKPRSSPSSIGQSSPRLGTDPKPLRPAPVPSDITLVPPAILPLPNLEPNLTPDTIQGKPSQTIASNQGANIQPNGSIVQKKSVGTVAQEQTPESAAQEQTTESASSSTGDRTSQDKYNESIAQVVETQEYFQKRWHPPQDWSQTLEYKLLLNADGSIQAVKPMTEDSAKHIDLTNMPLVGKPFVSNLESGKTATIRLVLRPDGKVQTFLESRN